MSDSVQPHRQQPTRLPRPWDSPGKNTGVGCHCLLQCMKVKSEREVTQSCPTHRPHGLKPTRLLHPWDSPGKSNGVGCRFLLHIIIILYYNWGKRGRESLVTYLRSLNLGHMATGRSHDSRSQGFIFACWWQGTLLSLIIGAATEINLLQSSLGACAPRC